MFKRMGPALRSISRCGATRQYVWQMVLAIAVALHASAASAEAARVKSCLQTAARQFGIDENLLLAIATVESGLNPSAINRRNPNGTRDIGLMQINSWWLPRLARQQITEDDLYDPCVSAKVGAWILADNIRRLGPRWLAVGAYNARSTTKRAAYVRRVQEALRRLTPPPGPT